MSHTLHPSAQSIAPAQADPAPKTPLQRMRQSLEGLSVGDALGMRFLVQPSRLQDRQLPPGPWRWSDDTHMALSVVENLAQYGTIEQSALIARFAHRYRKEPYRGYGFGMRRLLAKVPSGDQKTTNFAWKEAAQALFAGSGSYGNGAAMRAAPIGAFFANDPKRTAREAKLSAQVTHAHPEGQAGAIAVAVAASLLAAHHNAVATISKPLQGPDFLRAVLQYTPPGQTRAGIETACTISRKEIS